MLSLGLGVAVGLAVAVARDRLKKTKAVVYTCVGNGMSRPSSPACSELVVAVALSIQGGFDAPCVVPAGTLD